MSKGLLSDKQKTLAIVPIQCGNLRGTAFLVEGGRMLTARHVVDEYYNGGKPVVANFKGIDYTFTPHKLGTARDTMDVVVLTCNNPLFCAIPLVQNLYLKLMNMPFGSSEGKCLEVIGFPTELGGGIVEATIRPHTHVTDTLKNYDVVTVMEGQFTLHNYRGFSGSPVVTKSGYVVGIVTTETYGKLAYCSVERMARRLKHFGVTNIEHRWEVYEDSKLSLRKCHIQVEEAVAYAYGRYHEELHTPNAVQEKRIREFLDFTKRKRTKDAILSIVSGVQSEVMDALKRGEIKPSVPVNVSKKFGEDNLEELSDYLLQMRDLLKPNTPRRDKVNTLVQDGIRHLKKWDVLKKKFMCLHGKAGMGKTQLSCYLARQQAQEMKNNVYLLFGSQFDASHKAWEKMLEQLGMTEEDIEELNSRAKNEDHYGVFIIDALNEGAGDVYWKLNLKPLVDKIENYSHLKLVFTIRDPFAEEITKYIEPQKLADENLDGFTPKSTDKAIEKYFKNYSVEDRFRSQYRPQFKNPLFLVIFCEAYRLLTKEERDSLNRRILYRTYLTSRNGAVSEIAEEDERRNVTLLCMRQLAWYSVDQCLSGLIPRQRARRIADKICPMRTWKNSLLHALLYENLLMETLSDQTNEDMVMFEYENIADVMKAESIITSKLTDKQILALLQRTDVALGQKDLSRSKFENMVRALIAIWDRQKPVTDIEEFTTGRFGLQLVKAKDEYKDERNAALIRKWIKENREEYEPREILHNIDNEKTTLFETLHPYLLSLKMSKRDEEWTTIVNNYVESQGALHYIERLSRKEGCRERLLVILPWMLTTSDPDARQYLIRMIYRLLLEQPRGVLTLMDRFKECNDKYLLQGLYCAIYGVTLRSFDGELLDAVAKKIWKVFYEEEKHVPVDIVLRQWTLKILERAFYVVPKSDYFTRIKLPFKSRDPWKDILKKDIPENYFAKSGKGESLLRYSLESSSDFHRYVIGSNSFSESHEFFSSDDDGHYKGINLNDIALMMAPIIKNKYIYSEELSRYDGSRYSKDRHHNKTERIGKKYQWLALDEVYAKLTDHCWVKDQRSDKWAVAQDSEGLTREAWPWMTRRYDRFDPTIPSNEEIEWYAKRLQVMPEKDDEPYADNYEDYKKWIAAAETHPTVKMQWFNDGGKEWVRIYGFESDKHKFDKEERNTMLYYNTSFVRRSDSKKMKEWASDQDFSGRWMAERTDCIDFRWNEMPWSDSYKRLERNKWEEDENYPCKVLVAYDEQLQEEIYGMLNQDESYSYSSSMPCAEMMEEMGLYTAERGVVRKRDDGSVAAINTGIIQKGTGLLVRKDLLCEFMQRKKYRLFCFILGNKNAGDGKWNIYDSQDLSGCMMMDEKGEWTEVQKLRLVERQKGTPIAADPDRLDELKKKNETEGLNSREVLEMVEIERLLNEKQS